MKLAQRHSFDSDTDLLPGFGRFCRDLSTDLFEEDGMLVAKMALPGLVPEEIEISFEGDVLTVSGTREEEESEDDREYYNKEIRRGSFYRSIRLPKTVDVAQAAAQYRDGMLAVSLPIVDTEERVGIRIPVQGASE